MTYSLDSDLEIRLEVNLNFQVQLLIILLFQITAPEYDTLFLNKLILEIKNFLKATERKLDVLSYLMFFCFFRFFFHLKYEGRAKSYVTNRLL